MTRAEALAFSAEVDAHLAAWGQRIAAGSYTDRAAAYPMFWPGYRYDGASTKPTLPAPAVAPAPAVRCECGSEKAGCGAGAHSDWCPKAGRP